MWLKIDLPTRDAQATAAQSAAQTCVVHVGVPCGGARDAATSLTHAIVS